MRESVTYQAILEEGEAKGRAEGVKRALLRVGQKRFGPPDAVILAAIKAITDPEHVEALVERVLDVSSWDELLVPPGSAGITHPADHRGCHQSLNW